MTYFLAERRATHPSQQLEAGKLACTICGRLCLKAGQGEQSLSPESESAQASSGISKAESQDDVCNDTPCSSKMANVVEFICNATGFRSWSRRTKRYRRNIFLPIVLD